MAFYLKITIYKNLCNLVKKIIKLYFILENFKIKFNLFFMTKVQCASFCMKDCVFREKFIMK